MRLSVFRFARVLVFVLSLLPAFATAQQAPTFTKEQLDQMLAPIALYPDSLLSQVLMASTYPADVAEAAKWSKANPNSKGDDAVKAVAEPALGPERAVAGRLPAGACDDGRQARLGAEPRRRVPRVVRRT